MLKYKEMFDKFLLKSNFFLCFFNFMIIVILVLAAMFQKNNFIMISDYSKNTIICSLFGVLFFALLGLIYELDIPRNELNRILDNIEKHHSK